MTRRPAFTIVEMLVALTLLGVGVLGWLATGTAALCMSTAADRAVTAHLRARSRAAEVASRPCAAMRDGDAPGESWRIESAGNDIRLVHALVPFAGLDRPDTATYAVAVEC
jgi:prepilin-type N-terminal cleavage/methylation domain-containing protein